MADLMSRALQSSCSRRRARNLGGRSVGRSRPRLKDGGTVGAVDVVAAAAAGALAGWFVVRLLERHTRRPRYWWSLVGSTALAVSIIGPSRLADGASAVVLITLHVVTAVVVITGFARTLPGCGCGIDPRRRAPESNPAR